jgi:hypothetical protein
VIVLYEQLPCDVCIYHNVKHFIVPGTSDVDFTFLRLSCKDIITVSSQPFGTSQSSPTSPEPGLYRLYILFPSAFPSSLPVKTQLVAHAVQLPITKSNTSSDDILASALSKCISRQLAQAVLPWINPDRCLTSLRMWANIAVISVQG